jgi:hypothetical protein
MEIKTDAQILIVLFLATVPLQNVVWAQLTGTLKCFYGIL